MIEKETKVHFFTLAQLSPHIKDKKWRGVITESDSDKNTHPSDLLKYIFEFEQLLAGISHGDKVIVKVSNSVKSVCGMLPVWESGGVVVPLKEDTSDEATNEIAKDCNAKYIFYPDQGRIIEFNNYIIEEPMFIRKFKPIVCGTDLALIIYTSGSTGKPKGIMLTHSNVINAIYSIIHYLSLASSDSILCIMPLSFDYGLYQVFFSFFLDLKTVLYNEAIQPYKIIKALNDHAITVFPVVPSIASILGKMLQSPNVSVDFLRKITNTGGHLDTRIIKSLKEKIPRVEIYAMYGLTECKRALFLPPKDLNKKLGSVGTPIPGLDAAIFIPDTESPSSDNSNENKVKYHEAGPNEIGELYIKGPTIMQGYYNSSAKTGVAIIPGKYRDELWLATGDLFIRDEDGYFYYKGRKKELIKQGAYCLYPLDIEEIIVQHEKVQMACVVGKTDKDGLEIACAFIQLKDMNSSSKKEVELWIQETIDLNYRPREIFFIEQFSLNNNGKIDKSKLL